MKSYPCLVAYVLAAAFVSPVFGAHHQGGHATPKNPLAPVFLNPGKVLLDENFNQDKTLDKTFWSVGQHTTWTVAKGMLWGAQSTKEYQASRKDHKGTIPRMRINLPAQNFILAFSFRLHDPAPGEPRRGGLQAFFEFGHHLARVNYNDEGTKVLVDHEQTKYWHEPKTMVAPEQWHHVLAELRGDELVVRFADGPSMYIQHADVAKEKAQFGIVGYNFGTLEIDNVKLWAPGDGTHRVWRVAKEKIEGGDECGCASEVGLEKE